MGLLLERLLLLGVGVADLDLEFFSGSLDGVVVECLDDLLAIFPALEAAIKVSLKEEPKDQQDDIPCEANTTTMAILVTQDA